MFKMVITVHSFWLKDLPNTRYVDLRIILNFYNIDILNNVFRSPLSIWGWWDRQAIITMLVTKDSIKNHATPLISSIFKAKMEKEIASLSVKTSWLTKKWLRGFQV